MKNFYTKINIRSAQAFTLIETLVATAIITLVILGPLTVAATSAAYAKGTKDLLIATSLAHEGTELVRFKRDSTYIECENNPTTCVPITFQSTVSENNQQASWRVFKERMGNYLTKQSCFKEDNVEGCAFDFFGFTKTGSDAGERVTASDTDCPTLYRDDRSINHITDFTYVCKVNGAGFTDTGFTRIITLESKHAQNANDYQKMYEDDILVVSKVTYRGEHGLKHIVYVTDYLHSRP
jgi:type II secretory pathway pseudopilin PulG